MAGDQSEYSAVCIRSWLCVLVAHYVWSNRETILNARSWISILEFSLVRRHIRQLQQAIQACSVDEELGLAIEEARISLCKWTCRMMSYVFLIVVCILYICDHNGLNSKFCYINGALYLATHFVVAGPFPVTCRSLNLGGVVMYGQFFLFMLSYTPTELTHMVQMGSGRLMIRAVFGIMFSDVHKAIGFNVILSIEYLIVYLRVARDMGHRGYPFDKACLAELIALCNLSVILMSVNILVVRCAEIQKEEVSNARRWQESLRKLLAVLCDAVFTLGSDWRGVGACPMLTSMLKLDMKCADLEGLPFTSLVQEPDVPRLQDFFRIQEATSSNASSSMPAASLHISLRASDGTLVPVEVLDVAIAHPMKKNITHLIGIKHDLPSVPCQGTRLQTTDSSHSRASSASVNNQERIAFCNSGLRHGALPMTGAEAKTEYGAATEFTFDLSETTVLKKKHTRKKVESVDKAVQVQLAQSEFQSSAWHLGDPAASAHNACVSDIATAQNEASLQSSASESSFGNEVELEHDYSTQHDGMSLGEADRQGVTTGRPPLPPGSSAEMAKIRSDAWLAVERRRAKRLNSKKYRNHPLQVKRIAEQLDETPNETIRFCLLQMMENINVQHSGCCPLHSRMSSVTAQVPYFFARPCEFDRLHDKHILWQCPNCKALQCSSRDDDMLEEGTCICEVCCYDVVPVFAE